MQSLWDLFSLPVTGLHDIDEYIQAQLLLAVSCDPLMLRLPGEFHTCISQMSQSYFANILRNASLEDVFWKEQL